MNFRPTSRSSSFAAALLPAAAFAATLAVAAPAAAQREWPGKASAKGHLVLDQISGFRANTDGGLSYYGLIGFAVQKTSQDSFLNTNGAPTALDGTRTTTTFYVSPSADYFIIDHLSIGGHVELAFQSGSDETRISPTVTQTFSRPSTTDFTFLPRVGYMFDLGNHWAIWPRGGIGYTSRQVVVGADANASTEHFGAAIMDIDVGFLYRFTPGIFLRLAPDVTFSLGGTHSVSNNGLTFSANASLFQFSMVGGIGAMFDLL